MTDPCYVLVWADADLHLRVVGVYATRLQAERTAAAEHGVTVEWVDYANDTPPCWFADVAARDLPGRDPEPGFYLIASRQPTRDPNGDPEGFRENSLAEGAARTSRGNATPEAANTRTEVTASGVICGYDPGGAGAHGVAKLVVADGRTVSLFASTVGATEEVITMVERKPEVLALGIDVLTCWSSGPSGWRPADRWFREHYAAVAHRVVAPNGLRATRRHS